MPNITFINPYVDWAMALKPASDDYTLDTAVARTGRIGAMLHGKGGARVRHPEF